MEISCSIVLFHNSPEEIKNLSKSILNCSKKVKLYLMDNSADDSLRYHFDSPQIEYMYCGRNLGYGGGHNVAIEKAKDKSLYHLILNPDIEFGPQVLDNLFAFMESNKDVGLVMPKVLYRNGDIQYLCKKLPSPADLFLRRFIPSPVKFLFKRNLSAYELRDKDYNSVMEVPNLSGCFMFIRAEVFSKVGLFDNRYFMYLEDTDFCRRINAYYRTVYNPSVSIIHGYAKASYKNLNLLVHHLKSSIKYFNKWGWFKDKERSMINNSVNNFFIINSNAISPSN